MLSVCFSTVLGWLIHSEVPQNDLVFLLTFLFIDLAEVQRIQSQELRDKRGMLQNRKQWALLLGAFVHDARRQGWLPPHDTLNQFDSVKKVDIFAFVLGLILIHPLSRSITARVCSICFCVYRIG